MIKVTNKVPASNLVKELQFMIPKNINELDLDYHNDEIDTGFANYINP